MFDKGFTSVIDNGWQPFTHEYLHTVLPLEIRLSPHERMINGPIVIALPIGFSNASLNIEASSKHRRQLPSL